LRVAVIVNDMSEVNVDARLVAQGAALSRVDEQLVEMPNGCICCTLREDLLKEVRQLARQGRVTISLIESTWHSPSQCPSPPPSASPTKNGQSLADVARLDTMVTVVDGEKFLEDYLSLEALADRQLELSQEDERNIADLLIDQIEFANVLVINKIDRMEPLAVEQLQAILRRLNPKRGSASAERGRVAPRELLATGLSDEEKAAEAAGWMKELQGFHTPETEEYGITSFVYRAPPALPSRPSQRGAR
jgi:G3E family GTPase